MSIQRTLFLSPFMALTLLLTGCGFHLRGQMDIAPELKTLDVNTSDQVFNQELVVVLKANGIVVSDSGDYRLHVLSLERENKEVTLSGGGIVSDVELTGTLMWGLETTNGLVLFSPREIRTSRIYRYLYDNATASNSEEDLIWSELTQALLVSLMRQVSAISSQELATWTADARAAAEAVQQ